MRRRKGTIYLLQSNLSVYKRETFSWGLAPLHPINTYNCEVIIAPLLVCGGDCLFIERAKM